MTEPATITVTPNRPIMVGKTAIATLVAKPQTFKLYGEMVRAARAASGDFSTLFFRDWIMRCVEARDASGTAVPFTIADYLQWPASYGSALQRLQREGTDPAGTIVKDGNGTDEPCIYSLGKPLPGGGEGAEIGELEFLVRTVGDVEPVVLADGKFDQVSALIEHCATPLGADVTLQRLPGFAFDAITLVDGLTMMEVVLPRFFESGKP